MIFKTMKSEDVLKQLEGHKNILKEEMDKVLEYFSKLECVYCRGNCHPIVNSKQLFEKEGVLANFIAECSDCGAQFTPYTKIEIRGSQRNPLADD